VTEVKVVLATVLLGLAVYQVGLMAIGYGKVRLRMLEARPASSAHRAIGDTIAPITIVVALACIFAAEDDGGAHAIAGSALLAVLALKVVVVRWWRGASRFLPLLGLSLLTLFSITWATSAGSFLFGD
jgi:hypothetical protein